MLKGAEQSKSQPNVNSIDFQRVPIWHFFEGDWSFQQL